MKLEENTAWSQLVDATPEERAWAEEYLSCDETRYNPVTGKRELGRFQMMQPNGLFPSGLLRGLRRAVVTDGLGVEVVDKRPAAPCVPDPNADLAWLRPYQLEAVQAIVAHGRGLIKAPTGSGKSEIVIGATRALPCQWLAVVHRADLVQQMADRYALRTGLTAGTFTGGGWNPGDGNLTVSSFQALYKCAQERPAEFHAFMQRVGGIAVDEVHAQSAETYFFVTMACEARYRIGLSGTPLDRGDKESLHVIGALGPIIYQISTEVLTEAGILAKSVIRMVPVVQKPKSQWDFGGWAGVAKKFIVRSEVRNAAIVRAAVMAAKPALLFVERMEQGEALAVLLRAQGIPTDFAHGSFSVDERKAKVRRLLQGHHEVLICTVIFQEGIDIPALGSIIIGLGGKSVVAALQRIGRGMRMAAGKTTFEVYDLWDFGHPYLEKHAKERRAAYEREGHTVTIGWPGEPPWVPPAPPTVEEQAAQAQRDLTGK